MIGVGQSKSGRYQNHGIIGGPPRHLKCGYQNSGNPWSSNQGPKRYGNMPKKSQQTKRPLKLRTTRSPHEQPRQHGLSGHGSPTASWRTTEKKWLGPPPAQKKKIMNSVVTKEAP